jgi:methylated-DNA-[protein]-cysteine S-methyltransferase
MKPDTILVFPSRLGWMAAVVTGNTLKQLTFGHPTAAAAKAAVRPDLAAGAVPGEPNSPLARRLQAYAAGKPDDFHDLRVNPGPLSQFQRRVLDACRRIPYGSTASYADLAAKAGCPRAARAVGNCMAANRTPLLVPCHRVVCADGRLGAFSAPGGTAMKRRLLALEASN